MLWGILILKLQKPTSPSLTINHKTKQWLWYLIAAKKIVTKKN